MGQFVDRTGLRYGRLTVIERDTTRPPASRGARVHWRCRCDCGNEKTVTGNDLAKGDTTSCGCLRREMVGAINRAHGFTRKPTYRSWQAAKDRCHNPNSSKYAAYGGQGITMCESWCRSFETFLHDMGERPPGKTLDRLDQCRGYEPGNVRWATPQEQIDTRGNMRRYRWRGEFRTLKQVAAMEDIPYTSLTKRLREDALIQRAVAYVKAHQKPR